MDPTSSVKTTRDRRFRAVCGRLVREMKRLKVPGVSIGLYHDGKEYAAGFGVTSIEHPLPVTPDTLFQVGSISKTFTATLIMMLVEQGRLDLDAPVRRYIKDFRLRDPDVARCVTVRQLLTHMGGWVGDYFNDFGNGDDALAQMVRAIGSLPQVHPLGTIWSYNNTGFNIAARIIETVTKLPYEKAMQQTLLDPLRLEMTFFYPSDILFTHRFVVGHQTVKGRVRVARPWAIGRAGNGVGGVVSTVHDLLKYARFHMSHGRKSILSGDSLRAMRVPQVDAGARGQMGITWFIRQVDGLTVYGHGGATHGQQAYFCFIPGRNFALAILTNSDDGGILTDEIFKQALDVYFGARIRVPKPIAVPPAALKPFTGRYRIGTGCFDLKARGKYLVYHDIPLGGFPTPETPPGPALPPIRFLFYEQDKVIGLDEPYKDVLGDFLRDEKGRLRYFRIGGRAHKKIA